MTKPRHPEAKPKDLRGSSLEQNPSLHSYNDDMGSFKGLLFAFVYNRSVGHFYNNYDKNTVLNFIDYPVRSQSGTVAILTR